MKKEQTEAPNKSAGGKAADKIKGAYNWWDNLATLNAEDPLWLGVLKIGVRAVGIIVLLAISPFALLAIVIGFFAAL
ncbi:hypothetical protein CEQ90_05630 [Lewinellaceae bacterium SD302]|nr:hypothetical protein CEQ90_05630 [Lewinellaceae bacterium SD302]